MAVSMQRLQISKARISAIPIDMIHLDPVVMLEEQPAVATTPLLLFQQPGQSWIGVGMPSLPHTPVHPIAIVRTAVSLDLNMPRDCHLTVEVARPGVRAGRRSGKDLTSAKPTPVPWDDPSHGFVWMSLMCPGAELFPYERIKPRVDGLTHTGTIVTNGVSFLQTTQRV
jgi:hypothetical protein